MCLITSYHQDVDEVSRGGVPHLQRQIVRGCDHRAVMAIPRYHGNLQLGHLIFQWRRVVLPVGKMLMSCLHQLRSVWFILYAEEQIKDMM